MLLPTYPEKRNGQIINPRSVSLYADAAAVHHVPVAGGARGKDEHGTIVSDDSTNNRLIV